MNVIAPWNRSGWPRAAEARLDAALRDAGRPRTGRVETVKSWARSCVQTVPTESGTVWVKHGYELPQGEEKVLERLVQRWADRLPEVVATWEGGVAMAPLPGRELAETDPVEDWVAAARVLAELEAEEEAHVDEWLELGVRDRRPAAWAESVELLLESAVLEPLDSDLRRNFEALGPEFVVRYQQAFESPPTLIHQDSGCCKRSPHGRRAGVLRLGRRGGRARDVQL